MRVDEMLLFDSIDRRMWTDKEENRNGFVNRDSRLRQGFDNIKESMSIFLPRILLTQESRFSSHMSVSDIGQRISAKKFD